jgi:hypothetical protein
MALCSMLAIPEYAPGTRGWLIGQESWFVLGYQFAAITTTAQYRAWLRHTFTDDMLGQWLQTGRAKGCQRPLWWFWPPSYGGAA